MIGDSIQLKCPSGSNTFVFVDCKVVGPRGKRRLKFRFEFVEFTKKTETLKTTATIDSEMAAGFTRLSRLIDEGWRIVS
jgi:hypothetical protein